MIRVLCFSPFLNTLCFCYRHDPVSSFARLSIRMSNYEQQEDSSWLMARGTGGSEKLIRLWDRVSGWRGKLSCQGKKTDGLESIDMECYEGKRLAEKYFPFGCMCICFLLISELMHNTSKGAEQTVSEHILCTRSLAGPKGVKVNKAHFLPEKKLRYSLDFF